MHFPPYLGVDLGYNCVGADVDVDRSSFRRNPEVGYPGLQLLVTGTL